MQEFLPNTYPLGAVESVPGRVRRLRLSDVGRTLAAARRPVAAAPPAAQRLDRHRAVHACEGDRRRGGVHDRRSQRRRRSRRTGSTSTPKRAFVKLRSAPPAHGSGRVQRASGLLRDWTFTSQLTAGSGLPLTPVYLTSLAGTGVTGTIRAQLYRDARSTTRRTGST